MIITGNFYQTNTATDQTRTSTTTSEVDSIKALRTFFGDSSTEPEPTGFSDSVQISSQAMSVLRDYVQTNGLTEEDPMAELIKQNSMEKFFMLSTDYPTTGQTETENSALDDLSEMMKAFNDKQVSEVYAQIKEANQQLSGDFISSAARYGVQSLL